MRILTGVSLDSSPHFSRFFGRRRFFLATNNTFEGVCLALAGKFLQKELWILFVFKIILWKGFLNLVLSLS